MTLLRSNLKTTQEANKAFAKRRQAKRTRLQNGGTLTTEATRVLIAEKESGSRSKGKKVEEGGPSEAKPTTSRRCRRCAKPGHNVRTCPIALESSGEDSEMDSD